MTDGAIWQKCDTNCPPRQGRPPRCGELDTPLDAARALPECVNEAIIRLEEETDVVSRSYLAAAYYVRAQTSGRERDLLHALDAATAASGPQPPLPSAVFNRALIEEALGLRDRAIASWTEFTRLDNSDWAQEAREHIEAIRVARRNDAAVQWPVAKTTLERAIRMRDTKRLEQVIRAYPSGAATYVTETLLRHWAEKPTPSLLADARFLANELARVTKDRYEADVVAAVENTRDEEALREGLIAYGEARDAQENRLPQTAIDRYGRAVTALRRAGNPLAEEARVRGAFYDSDADIREDATQPRYLRLRGLAQSVLAHHEGLAKRFLNSVAWYNEAIATHTSRNDPEETIKTRARLVSPLRTAGQYDAAWRETVLALQNIGVLRNGRDREQLLTGASKAALELGHPAAALQYIDALLAHLAAEGINVPPPDAATRQKKASARASALRQRAACLIALGRDAEAYDVLQEARRLAQHLELHTLNAQLDATTGDALLNTDPIAAAAAYTRAIEGTGEKAMHNYAPHLYSQRAEAVRRSGGNPEPDLLTALAKLRAEEDAHLATRNVGKDEDFWSVYFARFLGPHRRLVQRYLQTNRPREAFAADENARAYELRDLLKHNTGRPVHTTDILQRAQAALPDGTFILQYTILEDRVYVFIVSKTTFEAVPLQAAGRDLEQWRAKLQRAVRRSKEGEFQAALVEPYQKLIATPWKRISSSVSGRMPHLVIIPDGALHGMPVAAFYDRTRRQFLIEDAILSTAPSTALYLAARARDAEIPPSPAPSLLLVGNPDVTLPGFRPLPGAQQEAEAIYDLYQRRGVLLRGREATIPQFLAHARDKTIIHIAAHSVVDEHEPWESFILFTPSPEHQSGQLTAEELITQSQWSRTRLMVLSSCSSAAGSPLGPEGVAPLVRPLLGAAVPAVIGTLWDVEDATASEFPVSFHRHYRSGMDAASAMQRAQAAMAGNKNIFTWAPYQLVGHASSPSAAPQKGTHNGFSFSHSVQRSDGLRPQ